MDNPFLMQAATITYDDYVGRQACGRILEGTVKKGQPMIHLDRKGQQTTRAQSPALKAIWDWKKSKWKKPGSAISSCISGIPEVTIGDTLCDPKQSRASSPNQTR